MAYTSLNSKGKLQIQSLDTFLAVTKSIKVLEAPSFLNLMTEAEGLVKTEHPSVNKNALSNVRGNWFEWLIAVGAVEFNLKFLKSHYLLPLPNVTSYDCSKLYIDKIHGYINDLKEKLSKTSSVSLVTSNPDFVIAKRKVNIGQPDLAGGITANIIHNIDSAYKKLEHQCELDDIVGYASSKSSLRPDRRLQISHEGSLMKALYQHIITREWKNDASGIKYYGITTKCTDADRKGLKTLATHSIADVKGQPVAAVDELYCAASGKELEEVFSKILL